MSDFFLVEIRMFAFDWPPESWALCNGAQLAIQQNAALYSLFGVAYGGDGQRYFQLPDLRGRVPVHVGNTPAGTYNLGNQGGAETVTLTQATTPTHTHQLSASTQVANSPVPAGRVLGATPTGHPYYAPASGSQTTPLTPASVGETGNGVPHPNVQPSAVINFCVSLQGLFPPRP